MIPSATRLRLLKNMYEFRVTGVVQGVNFRSSTANAARELSLRGWVKNTTDEAVEGVVASDDSAALDKFKQFLHKGPPSAQVDNVQWKEKSGADERALPTPFTVK